VRRSRCTRVRSSRPDRGARGSGQRLPTVPDHGAAKGGEPERGDEGHCQHLRHRHVPPRLALPAASASRSLRRLRDSDVALQIVAGSPSVTRAVTVDVGGKARDARRRSCDHGREHDGGCTSCRRAGAAKRNQGGGGLRQPHRPRFSCVLRHVVTCVAEGCRPRDSRRAHGHRNWSLDRRTGARERRSGWVQCASATVGRAHESAVVRPRTGLPSILGVVCSLPPCAWKDRPRTPEPLGRFFARSCRRRQRVSRRRTRRTRACLATASS